MPLPDLSLTLPPAQRYWVALSGGLDSVVLLHSLVHAHLDAEVRAVHVHHGLSTRADDWLAFCEAACAEWGVRCHSQRVNIAPDGKGLEAAARVARYRVFEQCLAPGDCLLTAHHGDDQAETLLLRLMRGSGPRGLAAMAPSRPLGQGVVYRPFLGVARAELEAYAQAHQLHWVEDDSNRDERFDRNFMRHRVIPVLRQRWPALASACRESAALCAESEALLVEMAEADLTRVRQDGVSERPRIGPVLSVRHLRALSSARRRNLLRHWIREQQLPIPGRERLAQIESQLVEGREDSSACVSWEGLALRRHADGLYLLRADWLRAPPALPDTTAIDPSVGGKYPLGSAGRIEVQAVATGALRLQAGLPDLHWRWRQGGERCQPSGRAHSQTLKKLLPAYGLESWWRPAVPLIYSGTALVAVGDLWVCRGFEAAEGQPGLRLRWFAPGSF